MAYYNNNRNASRQPRMPQCPCNETATNNTVNDTPAPRQTESRTASSFQEGLAIAYVPWQQFEELFSEEKAFMLGTAFPSLFKPFLAGGKC